MGAEINGLKERIAEALSSQQQGTITLLSSLLAIQDELGYIPAEGIQEVANYTRATINDVWGVASFYTNFRFNPPASHTVELCWGASCHVLGAMDVAKGVLGGLELSGEGDTPDGSVNVRFNTCLGACSHGPVISVDRKLVGRLSPAKAQEMVAQLLEAQ